MTRKEIIDTAKRHGVPEIFCRGTNKERLLHNIDRWWTNQMDYMIILYYPSSEDHPEYINALSRRDALREELNYFPSAKLSEQIT